MKLRNPTFLVATLPRCTARSSLSSGNRGSGASLDRARLQFLDLLALKKDENQRNGGLPHQSDEPFGRVSGPQRRVQLPQRRGQKNRGERILRQVQRSDHKPGANVIHRQIKNPERQRMPPAPQVHPLQEKQIAREPYGKENHAKNRSEERRVGKECRS